MAHARGHWHLLLQFCLPHERISCLQRAGGGFFFNYHLDFSFGPLNHPLPLLCPASDVWKGANLCLHAQVAHLVHLRRHSDVPIFWRVWVPDIS